MVNTGKQGAETQEEKKEMRLEIRLDADSHQRIKKMARYAALEGIIPDDHRGNITAWLNYCLNIGDELMTKHAQEKRGF